MYAFTHHLRERFIQRTNYKYSHIQTCREQNCKTCDSLKREIQIDISYDKKIIDSEISRRLKLAKTDRTHINNTEFMLHLYRTHGCEHRFEFLVHEDLVFVVIMRNYEKIVVTCVPSKTHVAGRSLYSKNSFKKKNKL